MKTTFERAGQKESEKACPYHISDNSSFIPPDDIVESLERNGHNVIVQKTLSSAEFHALFRDMSKYFDNQPKDTYVKGNPTS